MFRAFTFATTALLITTAAATAQPIVFVPEGSADTVRMVNAETGETIKRISGLEAVHGLSGAPGMPYLIAGSMPNYAAFGSDPDIVYVSNAGNGTISEVDLGRGEDKIAAIALSTGAVSIAPLSPEHYHLTNIPGTDRLFVSSRADPKVWIVDEATLTIVGDFQIEGEGHQKPTTGRDTDGSTHE